MKYYVVADPHGFCTILKTVLKQKGFFEDKEPHKLIVCGDLFDRGNEAKQMQEFICELIDKDEVILVKGNHEDLVQDFIDDLSEYSICMLQSGRHVHNGTVDTCCQLTNKSIAEIEAKPIEFKREMYQTDYFTKIIPAMVNYFETAHYIFVHGWIPCFVSGFNGSATYYSYVANWRNASNEQWSDARWNNGMLAASMGIVEQDKTIVCGHWHCSYGHARFENEGSEFGEDANFAPYIANGIIALDACTVISKQVNCIVIED